ncbi:hypothetical protein [Methylovulum psychrotolerans]|uniref:Uncharacterized protein n=1 Tax=Methylovulum psychrotolerans TaxID=1704499 RepID=A0A2S5CGH9_9GAMM|nr:hypothetical protein [Methylovulum psychrotolerans]POZ49904.1 hypothetical protein AADEFJLK_04350 [Methylovulum psychrotolerans]
MALTVGKKRQSTFTATLPEVGDGGKTINHTADVTLDVLKADEYAAVLKQNSDRALVERTLVNVVGLKDEDGNPMEFNDESKAALLEETWIVAALANYQVNLQRGISPADVTKRLLGN